MEGMSERMREVFREGGEKNRNKIGRWRWSRGRNKREGQIERREGEIGFHVIPEMW